jgi:hypothetical protein
MYIYCIDKLDIEKEYIGNGNRLRGENIEINKARGKRIPNKRGI